MEDITLTKSDLEALGFKDVADLTAKLKQASFSADKEATLTRVGEDLTKAADAMTQLIVEMKVSREAEAEAASFEELSKSKIVETYKSLADNDPEKLKIREEVAKALGGNYHNAEVLLDGSTLKKAISKPISPKVTKNYEELHDIHKAWDYANIMNAAYEGQTVGKAHDTLDRNHKSFMSCLDRLVKEECAGADEVRKAYGEVMDTVTATDGLEYVPLNLSGTLVQDVWLQLAVANLFRRYPMSSPSFKLPIRTGRSRGYAIGQATNANGVQIFTNLATPHSMDTNVVQFNAQKLGVLNLLSDELEQDSAVPILDILRDDIAYGHADSIEDAVINGARALNTLDNQGTDTNRLWANSVAGTSPQIATGTLDARYLWNGIRSFQRGISGVTFVDGSTFVTGTIRALRKTMGKYGVNPDDLVLLVSTTSYINILGLTEVLTMEKYGPEATIKTGEIGKVDGISIVVSPRIYTYLNATGVFDNVTKTKTAMYLIHRLGFAFGDRRQFMVESDRNPLAGQRYLLTTQRLDFKAMFLNTETITAESYNIA